MRSINSIFLVVVLFLLISLSVGIFFVFQKTDFLQVKEIICFSQFGVCPELLQAQLEKDYRGDNILFLSSGEVKGTARSYPVVRNVTVRKFFPSTLKVTTRIEKAWFAVGQSGSNKFILVDSEAKPIQTVEDSLLPKLYIESSWDQIGADVRKYAAEMIIYLSRSGYNVQAKFVEGGLEVVIGATMVVFPAYHEDARLLAGSLHFMLERFTMENKIPVKIDMRFKNPVVTFQ